MDVVRRDKGSGDMKAPQEIVIGEAVTVWLESRGWQVYPEVALKAYEGAADLVAVKGDVVWVVECKRGMTYQLLQQAWRWRDYADQLSVATMAPWRMGLSGYDARRDFGAVMIDRLGLGFFGVGLEGISVTTPPTFCPRKRDDFLHVVRAGHRVARAGQAGGARFTVVDATIANLVQHVQSHPGIAFKEAVRRIHHHHGTNKSALRALMTWVRPRGGLASRSPEIELRKEHGRWCAYPADETM